MISLHSVDSIIFAAKGRKADIFSELSSSHQDAEKKNPTEYQELSHTLRGSRQEILWRVYVINQLKMVQNCEVEGKLIRNFEKWKSEMFGVQTYIQPHLLKYLYAKKHCKQWPLQADCSVKESEECTIIHPQDKIVGKIKNRFN